MWLCEWRQEYFSPLDWIILIQLWILHGPTESKMMKLDWLTVANRETSRGRSVTRSTLYKIKHYVSYCGFSVVGLSQCLVRMKYPEFKATTVNTTLSNIYSCLLLFFIDPYSVGASEYCYFFAFELQTRKVHVKHECGCASECWRTRWTRLLSSSLQNNVIKSGIGLYVVLTRPML